MKVFDISLIKIKNMPVIPCRIIPEAITKRTTKTSVSKLKTGGSVEGERWSWHLDVRKKSYRPCTGSHVRA